MNAAPATILLIEDDLVYTRLIEKHFQRAGIANEIINISSGAKALAHLFERGEEAKAEPILVLLDLNLPDMNGVDILTRIKADPALKQAPVVVLTTSNDSEETRQCYDLGCNMFLTKPAEYSGFAALISQLHPFLDPPRAPPAEP